MIGRAGRYRTLFGMCIHIWSTKGLRERVTLIVSGGIAAAEHVAKAIACGADLVAVDYAAADRLGLCVVGRQRDMPG